MPGDIFGATVPGTKIRHFNILGVVTEKCRDVEEILDGMGKKDRPYYESQKGSEKKIKEYFFVIPAPEPESSFHKWGWIPDPFDAQGKQVRDDKNGYKTMKIINYFF